MYHHCAITAGSHREPLMEHADVYDADNLLTRGQVTTRDHHSTTSLFRRTLHHYAALCQVIPSLQDAPGPDKERVAEGVLEPGMMSLHHLATAHGGGPNVANERRIGFNVTYCAAHVHSVREEGAFGMVVRGSDPCDHLTHDPVPSGDTPTAEEQEAHRMKMEGMSRSIMEGANMAAFARVSEERVGRNVPS